MQNILSNHEFQDNEQHVATRIDSFFKQFAIADLARRCGICKAKGTPAVALLFCLLSLSFHRLNLYRYFRKDSTEFGKDAVYDFMRSSRFSWRRFLLQVAARVCSTLQELTSEKRETVLILDDSTITQAAIISKARVYLPVICMVKRTPKIHYEFEGERLSVDAIYKRLRKRPGRAKVLCSALVAMVLPETQWVAPVLLISG